MKKIAIAFVIYIITSSPILAENTVDGLKKEIRAMISMLSSNDHNELKKFIIKYAVPEEMAGKVNDEMVDVFKNRKKDRLLNALEAAVSGAPRLMSDGVTYRVSIGNGEDEIDFIYKANTGHFHIKN